MIEPEEREQLLSLLDSLTGRYALHLGHKDLSKPKEDCTSCKAEKMHLAVLQLIYRVDEAEAVCLAVQPELCNPDVVVAHSVWLSSRSNQKMARGAKAKEA